MSFLPSNFTLGILLGQASILFLIYLFVRYLLLADPDDPVSHSAAPKPRLRNVPPSSEKREIYRNANAQVQIIDAYRASLSTPPPNVLPSPAQAADTVRVRVEKWVNDHRSPDVMDEIVVHECDLGAGAPSVEDVRLSPHVKGGLKAEFDISYSPSSPPTISISTAILLNVPVSRFGSLPVSFNIALSHISGTLIFHIPPDSAPISMNLSSTPPLRLSLSQSSLVGSRAKLADLPKLHELVESRVRTVLEDQLGKAGEGWAFVLPGLGTGMGGVEGLARTVGEEVLGGDSAISS
ncbi:hypothetical protein DACRYDRAFT_107600 [Dacryopinax primogenitus]|uniref:SMP-LTD domain-containing protein n=1 Tax=Dacryopinax primogenitus (strain DJM 731) TaxID=1858805 RepID=M5G129_DACPD|nr:uncharacterized protein DACRYDRAFT_107600 [Dacryopinax primogenitus]EJU01865.1 hypothetical protein DACRYDRAFT_107600 [Dacryopinax primogenitus]